MAKIIDGKSIKKRMRQIAAAWESQGRSYEAMLLTGVVDSLVDTETAVPSSHQWVSTKERLPDDNIAFLRLLAVNLKNMSFWKMHIRLQNIFQITIGLLRDFPTGRTQL